ncbi:hypothetical protein HY003_00815 [Candidatus Saccharibacteria bacterium]|nr:hypothetical protein [Candidatus Saccharibacteria bacterium]MBI3337824.1 hypothetical protein [Candidatus Saccharibacteria bacterium]
MPPKLDADFARSVELSINPLTRHHQVDKLLHDPEIVGNDINFLFNPDSLVTTNPETVVALDRSVLLYPWLGRNALKQAALWIQYLTSEGLIHG